MILDFRKDYKVVWKYLEKRIREYPNYVNRGPGEDADPISMIEFGFEYDQDSWIALVFDTRPGARPDGSWNNYIEENMLEFPHWSKAGERLFEDQKSVKIVLTDGTKLTMNPDESVVGDFDEDVEDAMAHWIGEMLREALVEARVKKLLSTLPLAEDCIMGAKHHDGAYGWPIYENLLAEGKVN